MHVVEAGAPRPAKAWGHRILLMLSLVMLAAPGAVTARPMQPLDTIAEAAVAALGAGDAQSAEAVLAPTLRLARCSQPLQAVATGPTTAQV
ncbi:hypothetical protein ACQYWP_17975, partial [Luteimonas sp. SDU101]